MKQVIIRKMATCHHSEEHSHLATVYAQEVINSARPEPIEFIPFSEVFLERSSWLENEYWNQEFAPSPDLTKSSDYFAYHCLGEAIDSFTTAMRANNAYLLGTDVTYSLPETVFKSSYEQAIQNLNSYWGTIDSAEITIANLQSRVDTFQGAIESFWSKVTIAEQTATDSWVFDLSPTEHFRIPENGLGVRIPTWMQATARTAVSLVSFVARVVSKVQLLVVEFSERIARLIKLWRLGRLCKNFTSQVDEPLIQRTVIERKFFCTHGFHPPDLYLTAQLLGLVEAGCVPGPLPA